MISPLLLAALATPPQAAPEEAGVRLVVLVSVDQMIPEQLRRLAPWLEGGLRRFNEAEVHEDAWHAHGITDTAPGHATLATGLHPSRHGVVANAWLSPESGGSVYCVGDPAARALGPEGPAAERPSTSPRNLLAPGLGDFVKATDPGARALAVAGKDRAAILAGGREADLALWWAGAEGGFTSSDWYAEKLPDWVAEWNDSWTSRTAGRVWEELPLDLEGSGTDVDDRPGEPEGRRRFPHRAPAAGPAAVPGALGRWVFSSPLVDEYVLELATLAVDREELGQDESVDYLFVGLSGCDTVGHAYGPYSREVTDVLLRADRALGAFLDHLDRVVGEGRWLACLSSDHGVLALPERLRKRGLPARRHSLAQARRPLEELDRALAETYGEQLLHGVSWRGLRLARGRMDALGLEAAEVERFVADRLLALDSLERVLTRTELEAWRPERAGADPLLDVMARSHHPERSGDLTLVFGPWKVFQAYGTSHGSPWPYDRRVPLAFLGPGCAPGRSHEPAFTVDVCPTLLERAGLAIPEGLDGRPLR